MEEQTLHYYLKVFSTCVIFLLLCFSLYLFIFFNNNLVLKTKILKIEKGEKIENVLKKNVINVSNLDIFYFKLYYQLHNRNKKNFIHYGDFEINKPVTPREFLNLITRPSNVLNKITIIEGWSQDQLMYEISKYFSVSKKIPYEDIIADTYFFSKNQELDVFINKLTLESHSRSFLNLNLYL